MGNEKKNKTERITFRCTHDERKIIESKANSAKYSHCGEYIRRQLLDGIVYQMNEQFYSEMMKQVSAIGNNINQIARRANETRTLKKQDLIEFRDQLHDMKIYTEAMENAVNNMYSI